ncbi:hypothetical protein LCGC14_2474070, partial [marine sediment metagenome]
EAETMLAGTGLVPLRAGAVGKAQAAAVKDAKFVPGGGLSIPLVRGDNDWAAIGTVTEVMGDYVLGFGHSLYARGTVKLPMGPAYVHTTIASMATSFKLGSTLAVTGSLTDDEYTGVGGRIGEKAPMIPMTVVVRWGDVSQTFQYRLVRHNWLTASMASMVMRDSLWANRDLPERYTIDYAVDIDFEKYGKYHAANLTSSSGTWDMSSDLTRPMAAMMNSDLSRAVYPKRIDVSMTIHRVQKTADILALDLAEHTYRPGQTVKGKVTLRPYRAERIALDVSLTLPEDLPDGNYTVTVGDGYKLLEALRSDRPHRFDPRNMQQLFDAVKRVVEPRMDRLYLRLRLPGGGLAVKKNELKPLPASLAEVLARTSPMDTNTYRRSLTADFKAEFVVSGSASASFTVEKDPRRLH